MAVLAIDTCLAACSVAVLREDGRAFARSEVLGTGHAERVAPMAAEVLEEAGVPASELTRIVCTVGPGSFMGARVGVSLAKGMALPRGTPCVPMTTLEAIALGANGPTTVLIDARRGQAYAQRFGDGPTEPALLLYEVAAAIVRPGDTVRGAGLAKVLPGHEGEECYPDPAAMARRALTTLTGPLRPFYLRAPDAKPPSRAPL